MRIIYNWFKQLHPRRRKLIGGLGLVSVFLIFLYIFLFQPIFSLYAHAQEGKNIRERIKTALVNQNLTDLSPEINSSRVLLEAIEKDWERLSYLGVVPFLNRYYKDGQHLLTAGNYGVNAAEILVTALEPFTDVLGFVQTSQEEELSVEEKMGQVVTIAPQLVPAIDQATLELKKAVTELAKLHPEIYPEEFKGIRVKYQMQNIKYQMEQINSMLDDVKPLFQSLPAALGQPTPQTYLVLFQNDKELRPTGGFITAYAQVKFDQGKFSIFESNDIYSLDNDAVLLPTPQPILEFLKVKGLQMRDTNFKPDFYESMQDFEYYYERLNAPEISGIIALDTQFVESFLEITGPVTVPGYELDFEGFWNLPESCKAGGTDFTAENVICRLELYAQRIDLRAVQRKAVLGDLMDQLVVWVMNAPKEKWQPLIENVIKQAQEKHLLLYFHDETLQTLAEKYNFAGRVSAYDGDYLYVNDANLAGLKSDLYMQRSIKQGIDVADDGTVTKKLSLTYENTGEYDGWLNSTNRNYVRVYVPQGSELVSFSGGQKQPTVTEEFGKSVFDNFVLTKPLESSVVEFEYRLPFKIDKGQGYKILIQKQPGLESVRYEIEGVGEEFELRKDKEVEFRL